MTKTLRLIIPACILATIASCDANIMSPTRQLSSGGVAARAVNPPSLGTWPVSASTIGLSWTDDQRNETGWEVHRSTAGAGGAFTLLERLAANATSYTNTGLSPLTEYCYKVRFFKTSGPKTSFGTFTNVSCSQTFGPPPAASDLAAVPLNSSAVSVSWKDNATTEQSFRLERSADPLGPWETAATLGVNTQAYEDNGRSSEQQVCYRAMAVNQYGESASNVDCTAPPRAPTEISATANSQALIVAWTDASNVEEGYDLERALDDLIFATIASLPANTSSYTDGAASPETRYWYRVRARKDGGFSSFSNWVSAAFAAGPPRAPAEVRATPAGSTGSSITWTNVSPSATSFRIERSTDGRASWVTAGSTSEMWFSEGDRMTEREVCYRVFAINGVGDSPASDVDCTVPPAAPTNIATSAQPDGSTLVTWTDNSGVEDGFEIWTMICWNDYDYGWYCDYWNAYRVDANQTSASLVLYAEYGAIEQIATVFAVSDGGYSDQGTWAGASAAAAIVSSARGTVQPMRGARVPKALVESGMKAQPAPALRRRPQK